MRIAKYLSERKVKVSDYQLEIDIDDEKEVRGWVTNNLNANAVLISISSSSNEEVVIANQHRPDIRRLGLHATGYCGFQLEIADWKDTVVKVKVLSTVASTNYEPLDPLFFVHIPKTAGTSFRKAACDFFGDDAIVRDYGLKSPETDVCVKKYCYESFDFLSMHSYMKAQGIALYSGHVHLSPAKAVFSSKNIVTFVRNPVKQVVSHFNHYSRWYDYKGSTTDFITNKGFKNLQSRYLSGMPLQLIGLIGITEQYDDSIKLFNHLTQHNFKVRVDNINDAKPFGEVNDQIEALIENENEHDRKLYDFSKELFNQRLVVHESGFDWVYGFINAGNRKSISGAAYFSKSDEPVELEIYAGDTLLSVITSNKYRPGLVQYCVPRKGFIGFGFKIPERFTYSDIKVKVRDSGQQLTKLMTSL